MIRFCCVVYLVLGFRDVFVFVNYVLLTFSFDLFIEFLLFFWYNGKSGGWNRGWGVCRVLWNCCLVFCKWCVEFACDFVFCGVSIKVSLVEKLERV